MALSQITFPIKHRWQWILYLIFALLFYLTITREYRADLLYLHYQPFFAFDQSFYDYHFQFKSGILSLLSQFFMQFMYYPYAGAIILTALLIILALVFHGIFQKTIESGYSGIEFIAPILILWPLKTYSTGLETLIVFLFSGIIFIATDNSRRNLYLQMAVQWISIYIVFVVLGFPVAFVLLLFYSLKRLAHQITIISILFTVASIAYTAVLMLILGGPKVFLKYFDQFSFSGLDVTFPRFWYICIYISIAFLLIFLPINKWSVQYFSGKMQPFIKLAVFPLFIIFCFGIAYKTIFINPEKYKVEIDQLIENKKWAKVLSYKNKIGENDRVARFQMNRAIYETGQMSEDLFSIPQEWGEFSLLLSKEFSRECLPYSSDLFYDLGFMKASKYWMLEYQTYTPYAPQSLDRIGMTSLILGELSTARKYFTVLSKSIIYGKNYKKYLSRLAKEPLQLVKGSRPKTIAIIRDEISINHKEPDLDLFNILKVSPTNKMAFEYMMSYYILRNDLVSFYNFMPLVMKSGYYAHIPKTYQEALIQYYIETNQQIDTWEFPISKNTLERFKAFNKAFQSNKANRAKLKEILKPAYKDTYWYYQNFSSPNAGGSKLKFNNS